MKKKPLTLTCSTHGAAAWGGAVACPSCNRVYQTHDEKAGRYAPLRCCGKRLMPSTDPRDPNFSAVPVCNACAELSGIPMPSESVVEA